MYKESIATYEWPDGSYWKGRREDEAAAAANANGA
jgi:hypothetical protein